MPMSEPLTEGLIVLRSGDPVTEYRCTPPGCERLEKMPVLPEKVGGTDALMRARGWRIGEMPTGRVVLCPECMGTDPDYWDRSTLGMAYDAGIDYGSSWLT